MNECPVLVYDGGCPFCIRCAKHWKEKFKDRVAIISDSEAAESIPEARKRDLKKTIHFFEPGGRVTTGAEAIIRAAHHAGRAQWLGWCYRRVPGFDWLSEIVYRWIAAHRTLLSRWF